MTPAKITTFSLAVTEAGLTHAALEAAKAALAAVALDDNGYPISQDTREKVWTAAQAVREALKAREAFAAKAKADLAEAEALEEAPSGVKFLRDPKHVVHHTDGSPWAAYGGPDGWATIPTPEAADTLQGPVEGPEKVGYRGPRFGSGKPAVFEAYGVEAYGVVDGWPTIPAPVVLDDTPAALTPRVVAWLDRSPTGAHATQPDPDAQPLVGVDLRTVVGNPVAGWVDMDFGKAEARALEVLDTWAPTPEAPTDVDHDTPELPKDPTDVPHDGRPSWD